MKVIAWIIFGLVSVSSFSVMLLQGFGPFPSLTDGQQTRILMQAYGALAIFMLIGLEDKLSALAEGKTTQGSYQQGRKPTLAETFAPKDAGRLEGHWHKAYGSFPPSKDDYCKWYITDKYGVLGFYKQPKEIARECPNRDPRSTE